MNAQPRERRDISPGGFAVLAGSYIAVTAVGALAAFGLQAMLVRRYSKADRSVAPVVNVLPPEPRLETENSAELGKLRAQEDRLLSNYAWVDRQRGIARIPLGRAFELALARGFPAAGEKR